MNCVIGVFMNCTHPYEQPYELYLLGIILTNFPTGKCIPKVREPTLPSLEKGRMQLQDAEHVGTAMPELEI